MGKKEDLEKEEQKLIKIKLLLIKDFEELDKEELQVLRNYTREVYHIAGEIKLGVDELLNAYLIFKRKFYHHFGNCCGMSISDGRSGWKFL